MKKEGEPNFQDTPVTKWVVTDSDGTVAPFVKLAEMEKALPPKEFLEALRRFSFENPEVGIMILSGRKNGELNNFYGEALREDAEGKRPKFVLASENGAFLQLQPIATDELIISEQEEHMHQMAEPVSETLMQRVEAVMAAAAGEHYTNDSKDTSEDKWIRAEVKKYGFTAHYREPSDPNDKAEFEQVKEQIKAGFQKLGEEEDLEVHLGATSSFTIERVSKGATMRKLADNDPELSKVLLANGIVTEKPVQISYSGDDTGDRPALSELNKRFTEGTLEGYTSRPCNFTPHDPEGRTPNGPKELEVRDTFYILGSSEKLAQEMHRENFTDIAAFERLNTLRKTLSDAQLLPSQNEQQAVPPIVLLASGDILLQQPERYPQETLEQLREWSAGKVVLMANNEESKSNLEALATDNTNLIVATPDGQFYHNGTQIDYTEDFDQAKNQNIVISNDPERANEIQLLRAVQSSCLDMGLINTERQSQEHVSAQAQIAISVPEGSSLSAMTQAQQPAAQGSGPQQTPSSTRPRPEGPQDPVRPKRPRI
ncbi:MAG: hypothetical protein AAGB24_09815 [Bacteroidota bacterium]